MSMITTKAEFARRCGVSKPAIGDALRRGRLVATADGRIDCDDPTNRAYLDRRSSVADGVLHNPNHSRIEPAPVSPGPAHDRAELELFRLEQQGLKLSLENKKIAGELVDKAMVIQGFYSPIDEMCRRLLVDCVRSSVGLIHPLIQSGGSVEDAEVVLRRQLQNAITACKGKIRAFYEGALETACISEERPAP